MSRLKYIILFILLCVIANSFEQTSDFLVKAVPQGGIYNGETVVTLTSSPEAKIYYTLDGAEPNSSSFRYSQPITVKTVNVIRAVAYLNGKKSPIATESYFCDRSYTLPVISIATNPANLWDYDVGIYVMGCCADTIEPYVGANFWKDWEKRANIEMYEPNGELCFNQTAGINLFGGFSRMLPQKSLAVFARSKYGNNRFEYPIFPERDIDEYKSFIIRNAGGDFRRAHLRDAFMTQLAKPTGVAIQAYRPAIVFLNGEYWGIQNIREKISEHYLDDNFDVDKDNVDILRHNGVVRHGTSKNYKQLLQFLRSNDLKNDSIVEHLRTFMDVDDFIRYNIAETYSDNRDAGGNIRYWREREDGAKWRWVFYDLDLGLGNNEPNGYKNNTLKKFTNANAEAWPDPAWSTFIIRKLLENEKLKYQYINTFADHLNTVYHQDTAVKLLRSMALAIDDEMVFHVKRWKTSHENWKYHVARVEEFVQNRPTYVRQHIQEKFGLDGTSKVNIDHPGVDVAEIKFNSIKVEKYFEGIYFNNVPVTISVKPKHDYVFVGWEGRSEKTKKLQVILNSNLSLKPIFEPRKRSVWSDSIVLNELCVYQVEKDSSDDWIELYNRSNETINLSNWGITDGDFKGRFKLPENTLLKAHEFLIIAKNPVSFGLVYGDTLPVIGDLNFGLKAEGELIKLYDDLGQIVDSLTYDNVENKELKSWNRRHPNDLGNGLDDWTLEYPRPGKMSMEHELFLKAEAEKAHWKKVYFISGGGFFFILLAGLVSYRLFKKRSKKGRT
jgi:hypothetical protein